MTNIKSPNRRNFIKSVGGLGMAHFASPFLFNLAAAGNAIASSATGYKALICVNLAGGMDQTNAIAAYDDLNYEMYRSLRPLTCLPKSLLNANALDPLNDLTHLYNGRDPGNTLGNSMKLGLGEGFEDFLPLFNEQRKLAILMNTGVLHTPVDYDGIDWTQSDKQIKSKFPNSRSQSFSHGICQREFNSIDHINDFRGFGSGLISSLPAGFNGQYGDLISSLKAGKHSGAFGTGGQVRSLAISEGALTNFESALKGYLNSPGIRVRGEKADQIAEGMLARFRGEGVPYEASLIQQQLFSTLSGAVNNSEQIKKVMGDDEVDYSEFFRLPSQYRGGNGQGISDYSLGRDFARILKAIQASKDLGARRQVYTVTLGGWDHHSNLRQNLPLNARHLTLSMYQLQAALDQLGLSDSVTTFTISEFGRTLKGYSGSNHGYGSHMFVMGGAVDGGKVYGNTPTYDVEGPDVIGKRSLFPSTSKDQYFAALAKWFGITDEATLGAICPHLKNFDNKIPPLFKA